MKTTIRQSAVAALIMALALLLAACTGTDATGDVGGGGDETEEPEGTEAEGEAAEGADTVAGGLDLSGVTIAVGSKDFTEQQVLGEVMSQALAAAGAEVSEQFGLGSAVVREALVGGDVDAYYEYTGTGWITYLGETTPLPDETEQFEAVAEADAANEIAWFAPAAANNTYAVAANTEAVEEYSPTTVSDYAELVNSDPEAAALCTATEFISRDDGLPGLEAHYGFDLPDAQVNEFDFTLVHQQLAEGSVCDFGIVFATDGLIAVNDETVLEDDQNFFPKYNIAVSMRQEVYDANADAYETLFTAISEVMTDEKMQELNSLVDSEGQDPADVAQEFLQSEGII